MISYNARGDFYIEDIGIVGDGASTSSLEKLNRPAKPLGPGSGKNK
jgi:hypothetical protein